NRASTLPSGRDASVKARALAWRTHDGARDRPSAVTISSLESRANVDASAASPIELRLLLAPAVEPEGAEAKGRHHARARLAPPRRDRRARAGHPVASRERLEEAVGEAKVPHGARDLSLLDQEAAVAR